MVSETQLIPATMNNPQGAPVIPFNVPRRAIIRPPLG
jgi:hypothetical protein